jgi:hypothetical protein
MLTLALGASGHIFFWTVIFTHVCWAILVCLSARRPISAVVKTQILVLVVASPLIAFASYQRGTTLSDMSSDFLSFAAEFVQFGFVLATSHSGFFQALPAELPVIRAILLVCCLAAAVIGIRQFRESEIHLMNATEGPQPGIWFLGAALSSSIILGFIWAAYRFTAPYPTINTTKLLVPLPLVIAVIAYTMHRVWPAMVNSRRWQLPEIGAAALVAMLAFVPFLLLLGVSTVKPILNQRGMLLVTPYVLLVVSAGFAQILRWQRWLLLPAAAGFVWMIVLSAQTYAYMNVDPADYKAFAGRLTPEMRPGDMVFLRRRYNVTPVLYYLDASRYQLIARNYAEACKKNPKARVWAVSLYDSKIPDSISAALEAYRLVRTIEMPYAHADLYEASTLIAVHEERAADFDARHAHTMR